MGFEFAFYHAVKIKAFAMKLEKKLRTSGWAIV